MVNIALRNDNILFSLYLFWFWCFFLFLLLIYADWCIIDVDNGDKEGLAIETNVELPKKRKKSTMILTNSLFQGTKAKLYNLARGTQQHDV